MVKLPKYKLVHLQSTRLVGFKQGWVHIIRGIFQTLLVVKRQWSKLHLFAGLIPGQIALFFISAIPDDHCAKAFRPPRIHQTDPRVTMPVAELGWKVPPERLPMGSTDHGLGHDVTLKGWIVWAHHPKALLMSLQVCDKGGQPSSGHKANVIIQLVKIVISLGHSNRKEDVPNECNGPGHT